MGSDRGKSRAIGGPGSPAPQRSSSLVGSLDRARAAAARLLPSAWRSASAGEPVDRADRHAALLVAAVDALGSKGGCEREVAALRRELGRSGLRCGRLPASFLDRLVENTAAAQAGGEPERGWIEELGRLENSTLRPEEWLELYFLSQRVGSYEAAFRLRELSARGALAEAGRARSRPKMLRYAFRAALDLGDHEEAARLNGRLAEGRDSRSQSTREGYLRLLRGEREALRVDASVLADRDRRFAERIAGRSVAIAGPAEATQPHGDEIDGFDVVVKFNYRRSGLGCDPATQGKRVDVSYFNRINTERIRGKQRGSIPDDLAWAVLKSEDECAMVQTEAATRTFADHSSILFNGVCNAMPNAMLDLLQFGPSRIKVFNTDLMLSGRHSGYQHEYHARFTRENHFLRSAISHDPISHFRVLERLWRCGHIEADARLAEILTAGAESYARDLQRLYCVHPERQRQIEISGE